MRENIETRIQARDQRIGVIAFRKVWLEKEVENIDRELAALEAANQSDGQTLADWDSAVAVERAKWEAGQAEANKPLEE